MKAYADTKPLQINALFSWPAVNVKIFFYAEIVFNKIMQVLNSVLAKILKLAAASKRYPFRIVFLDFRIKKKECTLKSSGCARSSSASVSHSVLAILPRCIASSRFVQFKFKCIKLHEKMMADCRMKFVSLLCFQTRKEIETEVRAVTSNRKTN